MIEKIIRRIRQLIICIMLLSACPINASAEISARLDRDTIYFGEIVRLIIESDEVNDNAQPDFSALKQNFEMSGTSTSQNISIVNGQQTSSKQWVTELDPKAVGSFTIPPLKVGDQQTRPLRLTVLPDNPQQSGQTRDVFVEVSVDRQVWYVQQQITFNVKLYLGVDIIDGSLPDPALDNADVRRLGDDIQFTARVGQRNYRVIERRFAIFPDSSGELVIPPIRFRGIMRDRSGSGSQAFNSLFNQGERLNAKSKAVTLTILPPSPGFSGRTWLPAKSLKITELVGNSPDNVQEFEIGQPFTRKIEISAIGLTAEQLPDIPLPESDSFKQYPDKTNRQSQQDGDNIIGAVTQSIAIIPSQAGQITLPEINIRWWNTRTNTMETATLAERTMRVTADQDNKAVTDVAPAASQPEQVTSTGKQPENWSTAGENPWKWVSLLLMVCWVATLACLWRSKNHKPRKIDAETLHEHADKDSIRLLAELKLACRKNEARAAREKLQSWAKCFWADFPPATLDDIARRIESEELADQINTLNACLYAENNSACAGEHAQKWSGERLAALFGEIDTGKIRKPKDDSGLPRLYPQ